jgi:hypothetical protein
MSIFVSQVEQGAWKQIANGVQTVDKSGKWEFFPRRLYNELVIVHGKPI